MEKNRAFQNPIKYLVFSSGGVRGLAFLGAWMTMEDIILSKGGEDGLDRFYADLKGVAGTSAGSLLAMAIAADFRPQDILQDVEKINFSQIMNQMDLVTLSQTYGLQRGDVIYDSVKEILSPKYSPHITMKELHDITGKEFIVTTTNLTAGKLELLSWKTTPDLEVAKAVVMSSAVPFMFSPVEWKGSLYVDGCVTCDLPMHVFPMEETLGMKLAYHGKLDPIDGLRAYAFRLGYVAMQALEKAQIEKYAKLPTADDETTSPNVLRADILEIIIEDVFALNFFIKKKDVRRIISLGRVAAWKAFLGDSNLTERVVRFALRTILSTTTTPNQRRKE